MEAQQLNMKTGSAVSGIIMFEVILLGLMAVSYTHLDVYKRQGVLLLPLSAGDSPGHRFQNPPLDCAEALLEVCAPRAVGA